LPHYGLPDIAFAKWATFSGCSAGDRVQTAV
jgi:hypothetical protein